MEIWTKPTHIANISLSLESVAQQQMMLLLVKQNANYNFWLAVMAKAWDHIDADKEFQISV